MEPMGVKGARGRNERVRVKPIDLRGCAGLLSFTPMPILSLRSPSKRMRGVLCVCTIQALGLAVWAGQLHAQQPKALLQEVATGTGMPRSQRHESRHEIDHLEAEWRDAVLKPNTKLMDSLLADDYLAITPSGMVQTKEDTLANLRTGRTHLSTLTVSDRKVRFYGTTAVVTSMATVEGTVGDEPLTGSFRYTRVYVRDAKGGWKIVSFEASKVR